MAFGNNRKGEQPRAHFRLAGGAVMKFRHPYFAGQIAGAADANIDEIDVSASVKLDGRYFEATQNQDSAKQVVLVDGSVVTVSNKLLNGTMTIPAIQTTGFVGTGDFIAACQLIKSVGDTVGGLFTKTDFINGKARTRVYYGVTVKSVPDDVAEGNDVAVYNVQLFYAGWIEALGTTQAENKKQIWAVGNQQGLAGYFNPYSLQNDNGNGGTKDSYLSTSNNSVLGTADDVTDTYNENNKQQISSIKDAANAPWKDLVTDDTVISQ